MRNRQQVEFEIELVTTIGDLVQTYEEIYVTKMQKVRDVVTGSREFIKGLAQIYSELKYLYKHDVEEMFKSKSIKGIMELLQKNDKEVVVLLSASDKLSGDINLKVFKTFWQYISSKDDVDIVIAGKLGKKFFEQMNSSRNYHFFDLPEKVLGIGDLKPILQFLIHYSKVKVFYGKFQSFANQQATLSEVTGDQIQIDKIKATGPIKHFLFEPNLEELLEFFETQIFNTLFQQAINESYLSQVGSRVMSLESTASKVEEQFKYLIYEKRKMNKRKRNRKQLQSLSGFVFMNYR